jgi:hypothetical protein
MFIIALNPDLDIGMKTSFIEYIGALLFTQSDTNKYAASSHMKPSVFLALSSEQFSSQFVIQNLNRYIGKVLYSGV